MGRPQEPDSPSDDLRLQGFANGCARFAAGEGMQYSQGSVLFACTFGGGREKGQIWKLTPSAFEGTPDEKKDPGYLELYLEPNDADLLENRTMCSLGGNTCARTARPLNTSSVLLRMGRFLSSQRTR